MKKKILSIFVLVTAITAIAAFALGCGNSSSYPDDGKGDDGSGTIIVETDGEGRKLLREINIDVTADKGKVPETLAGVLDSLATAGGSETGRYASSSSSYSYVRLTLKVPSDKTDEFVSALKTAYKTSDVREYVTDVTEKYNAYKSQLAELKQEKEFYDELYADPSATVADKITIHDRLKEINAAIKEAETNSSPYEGLGSYATVNVWIDSDGNGDAGIAVALVFGVLIPVAIAAALVIVGVKKKRLKEVGKTDDKQ